MTFQPNTRIISADASLIYQARGFVAPSSDLAKCKVGASRPLVLLGPTALRSGATFYKQIAAECS